MDKKEYLIKPVNKRGNSGYIYLPKKYIGKMATIIILGTESESIDDKTLWSGVELRKFIKEKCTTEIREVCKDLLRDLNNHSDWV